MRLASNLTVPLKEQLIGNHVRKLLDDECSAQDGIASTDYDLFNKLFMYILAFLSSYDGFAEDGPTETRSAT